MLLFDMDGTLIDSNGIWKDVDEEFLARRGLPYTQEYYEGVAHTIFPLAARFTKEFCHLPESQEEIMAEWMELAGDIYATSVEEKPGVRAFLEKMKAAGERMAVVTSAVPVVSRWHAKPERRKCTSLLRHRKFASRTFMVLICRAPRN